MEQREGNMRVRAPDHCGDRAGEIQHPGVRQPHVVLVGTYARFEKGKPVERPDESGGDQQVA